ncbi:MULTISPECIES: protein-disulfide reductase DsbD domain-containing protein [unclassified Haematobacter]|uniref:protein-disulfide reductase DsbD domain-containing protein n=1 Tax=unclassified Haematobacter TaxID=2640585 RepID=UPI0025BEBC30|nr:MULTISPECIES: protein-disulfide reductase DsbD domain-containing protein [unclassified Haematobacter]
MMLSPLPLLAFAAATLLPALAGHAAPTRPQDVVQAEVLPGWRQADGSHLAAIRLTLADQWKTYWRAPGDAGIPPGFDWSGSENLADVTLHWPAPHVFELNGMRTVGYTRELVLPLEIRARNADQPISLRSHVMLGVCRDICVPVDLRIDAVLPVTKQPDPAIRAALASGPLDADMAGVKSLRCRVEAIPDGLRVTASFQAPSLGGRELAVFETPDPSVWVSESDTRREAHGVTASADLVPPPGETLALDRSRLRITLIGDRGAVDMLGCPAG